MGHLLKIWRKLAYLLILLQCKNSLASFALDSQFFIANLISLTKFQDCEIISVFPQVIDNEYYISHEYLLKSQLKSAGNFNLGIYANVSYRRARLEDVHRYNSKSCGLGVIFVPKSFDENKLPQWFFDVTTALYAPLFRKDEDHFLFICGQNPACDKMFLSSQYGNKIKFKLALSQKEVLGKLVPALSMVDLFGNHGEPVLKTLDFNTSNLFHDTTTYFNGKVFKLSNPRSHTYYDIERLPDGKWRGLRGLYKNWLDTIGEKLNFSVDVFESSLSGGSGKQLPNGTWGGTVGDVLYGTADMGAFVGHTFQRHEQVSYSAIITYEWMLFISHKPRHYYASTAVFKPLSLALWFGFLVSLVFMGFAFKLILRSKYSVQSFANYIFASFIEQDAGIYMDDSKHAFRILVSFWLFYALVFSTAYRGKLVGLIAFPMSTWVPRTYEDLAYNDYRIGLHVVGKGGAADSIFSSSSNPVFQILNSRMETFPEPTLCMKEALSHNLACVLWKCHYEYGLHDGFTDKHGQSPFQFSTQSFYFLHDGYIWEKRAVFGSRINKLGWPLLENGIVDYWLVDDHKVVMNLRFQREEELAKNGTKPLDLSSHFDEDDGPSKLKLAQFKGVFILFFCGLLAALICFYVERWKYKRIIVNTNHACSFFSVNSHIMKWNLEVV